MKQELNSKEALVLLNRIQGLGPVSIHRLLDVYGKAEDVFRAGPVALKVVLGSHSEEGVVDRILTAERSAFEEELRLASDAGVRIITLLDSDYPALLKAIPYAPPVLYVKGTLIPEDEAAVGMVGTRMATPYGLGVAKRYA